MELLEKSLSEKNRGEQIASKMYDVLDKVKQPQNHEALSSAANEFADGTFDKGQRILEENGFWHDTIREVVVEANQVERDKKGNTPLSFSEAKRTINGYAKLLAESNTREDKKSALIIESIVLSTDRPGIEGVDEALKYIEGVLQTKAKSERNLTPEIKKEWDEQRAVRDALFAEKQRRIEKTQEQVQKSSEPRVNEETIQKSKEQDEKELAGLRESLGLNEKVPEKIPTDEKGLIKYFNDNFGKMESASLEEFKKEFTPDIESNFQAWVNQHLKTLVEGKPANARYPDNVASVFGGNAPLLQRIIALKEGKITNMDELTKMSFSEVAKKYLNIDLPEDYFNNFSPR